MPSSGYPMENFTQNSTEPKVPVTTTMKVIEDNAKEAMKNGLFIEWLECFVGTWNCLNNTSKIMAVSDMANIASQSGGNEWDF